MLLYEAHFVHKISPDSSDIKGPFKIPDSAFSNRNTLGKALREAGVLSSGQSLRTFRTEGDKVIAFPRASIWHVIALVPAGEYATHAVLGTGRRSRY